MHQTYKLTFFKNSRNYYELFYLRWDKTHCTTTPQQFLVKYSSVSEVWLVRFQDRVCLPPPLTEGRGSSWLRCCHWPWSPYWVCGCSVCTSWRTLSRSNRTTKRLVHHLPSLTMRAHRQWSINPENYLFELYIWPLCYL